MHFVDYVNFVLELLGNKLHAAPQFFDAFNAAIARRIHFDYVGCAPVGYGRANMAYSARLASDYIWAVERFCEYSSDACFACAARAAEKVRMSDSTAAHCAFQNVYDMLLTDDLAECAAAVLAI